MNSKDMAIGYALGYNDGLGKSSGESSGDSGETNKWVRPADWPAMPEPADNQVIALVSAQWNTYPYEYVKLYAYKYRGSTAFFDGTTAFSVDWGDGTSETIELPNSVQYKEQYHNFYDSENFSWNDGPVLNNGAHVFVITVTIPDNAYFAMGNGCYALEMYIGRNVKFYNEIPGSTRQMLEHVKFFGWQPTEDNIGMMKSCQVLQCVDTTEPFVYIPQSAFYFCNNLSEIDLSKCTEVDNSGFANTALTKVVSDSLTVIGSSAFISCYRLESVDTPNLSTVGNSAFSSCYNIESITHAEDWTYSSNAFSSLYKWYDNPTMEHPQYS